jgi:lycopene cyclase domain-containing protein
MEYLLSLIVVSIFPVYYISRNRHLIRSAVTVVAASLVIGFVWDYTAIARGWWTYSDGFLIEPKLFGVPLEDLIFMVVVTAFGISLYDLAVKNKHEWKNYFYS